MLLTLVLEIIVSTIFFSNKVLVLFDKKSGWLVGAIGAALAVYYSIRIELYIFAVMQGGLVVLMGFGALPERWKKPKIETIIRVIIVLVLTVLLYFLAFGEINLLQFVASVLIIWGTYSLTHGKPVIGWILYLVAHLIAAYICLEKDQYIASFTQAASAVVSIIALVRLEKQPLSS